MNKLAFGEATEAHERLEASAGKGGRLTARQQKAMGLILSGLGYKAIALAMERGDAKVALAIFKGLGVLQERRVEEEKDEVKVIYQRAVWRGEPRESGGGGEGGG